MPLSQGSKRSSASALALGLCLGAPALAATDCAALDGHAIGIEDAMVTSATLAEAESGLPQHCILTGIAQERVGIDGSPYAIRFEMRLPEDWNGGFVHQLNGGTSGSVLAATGHLLGGNRDLTALSRGYAVLSHDAGHANGVNPDWGNVGDYRFGLDPQARVNYGYGADLVMTDVAGALIEARYGTPAERNYGVGCSNGGRSAMILATRVPEPYDGFLVGAPGFNLPRASLRSPWEISALHSINGDVREAFSAEELRMVAGAIRDSCDALDGVEDGMVLDMAQCEATFDITALQCTGGANDSCLSAQQVEVLQTIHQGPQTSAGSPVYASWPWDPAIGGGGYRFLRMRSGNEGWDFMPLNVMRGAGTPAYIFGTPPVELEGTSTAMLDFLLNFDMDEGAQRLWATDGVYTEAPMSFMRPLDVDEPTMAEFRAAGGRMVLFHGTGDAVFSSNDTQAWFEALSANSNGAVDEFATYYPVPAMAHCSGGPSTDDFDLFTTLVDWVENDIAPAAVIASVRADNNDLAEGWSRSRTRPLCQFPQVARYTGGDVESAESFTCAD
ncbi:MAG: tannase/feruloyl esterase family alpha/beta hydrolase [Pararhodobacter sp.]